MKQCKIGLVLSGGGAKGAYEVGVWRAICEVFGVASVKAISGSSIGGINSALFAANGDDLDAIERIWLDGMSVFSEVRKVATTYANKLQQILDEILPAKWPDNCPKVYATATDVKSKRRRSFRVDEMAKASAMNVLRATAAHPVLFPTVEIDNRFYYDGGLEMMGGDNVPAEPIARECPEIDTFIAVFLGDVHDYRRRVRMYCGEYRKLVEVIPSKDISGVLGQWGTFDFALEKIKELIGLGYVDAMAAFRRPLTGKNLLMNRVKVSFDNERRSLDVPLEAAARDCTDGVASLTVKVSITDAFGDAVQVDECGKIPKIEIERC